MPVKKYPWLKTLMAGPFARGPRTTCAKVLQIIVDLTLTRAWVYKGFAVEQRAAIPALDVRSLCPFADQTVEMVAAAEPLFL